MRNLLLVGGPHDGAAMRVADHIRTVTVTGWPGIYRRKALSANVDVMEHEMPVPNRWEPRRRSANFGVDRKPFRR